MSLGGPFRLDNFTKKEKKLAGQRRQNELPGTWNARLAKLCERKLCVFPTCSIPHRHAPALVLSAQLSTLNQVRGHPEMKPEGRSETGDFGPPGGDGASQGINTAGGD